MVYITHRQRNYLGRSRLLSKTCTIALNIHQSETHMMRHSETRGNNLHTLFYLQVPNLVDIHRSPRVLDTMRSAMHIHPPVPRNRDEKVHNSETVSLC